MRLLRMILHFSSLAFPLYTHITNTYAILFTDLTYHHDFLMIYGFREKNKKSLRYVLLLMREIVERINSVIRKLLTEEMVAEEIPMTTALLRNFVNKLVIPTRLVPMEAPLPLIALMTVLIIPIVNVLPNIIKFVIRLLENKVLGILAAVNIKNVVISVLIINIPLFRRGM